MCTDFRIAGRGLDFVWARKYRSRIGPDTAMGNGWDFSYDIFIEPVGPDILLHDGNTREDLYLFQPATNTWEADEFFCEFTFDPNPPPFGMYTLTFPDTGVWRFLPLDGSPQQGKISEMVDRNGNTVFFEYDGLGRLSAIHDTLDNPPANPRVITVNYDPNGFIQSVTDFTGRTVTYAYYDGIEPGGNFGDLKSVTTPPVVGTPNGNDYPSGKTTVYTYSTGLPDPQLNGNLLTITDPKGQTFLTNEYAPTLNPLDLDFDHLVRQTWGDPTDIIDLVYTALIPDPANNFAVVKSTVNDRVGNVSEHFFDASNRLVIRRDHTGRADPAMPTDIDAAINPPTSPLRPATDPPFFEQRIEWNIDALPTLVTHPNGNMTQKIYESDLNPLAPRRARGNLREVHRIPGPLGGDQPQIDEFFEYQPGFGGCCGTNFVTRHVDGRGNETLHTYDANGNRLQTTHRIPTIVEDFTYNAFGQMTSHTLPDNGSGSRRVDTFTYYGPADGCMNGYLKERIIDTPGFGLTTTYEYDCLGRLTRTIDPRGADSLTEYNALDQIVRQQSREVTLGGGVRYERLTWYDPNDNVIRIDIENKDDQGVLDAGNTHFSTIYEYDILNYLVRECREVGIAALTPADLDCTALPPSESLTTEFAYDANRNRTLVRFGESVNGNQPTNTVQTLYDERDLVFQVTRAPGDPDQSTTQTDYDANGNVTAVRQGLEGPASNPPSSVRVTVHTYDGYDRLMQTVDPMGNVIDYHYDANGNVGGDSAPGVPNPFAIRIQGELNDVPGGAGNVPLSVTQYEYDAMDRLTRTVTDFFDTDTQTPINLPPTADGKSTTQVQWTDTSQVRLVIDDNLHQTTTLYDTANRVLTVTDPKGNTITSAYDANSNVVSVVEVDKSDLLNPDQTFTTNYVYDNLDRLIRIVDNVGNTRDDAWDSRNNRTQAIDALGNETRYVYDGINRLIRTVRDMDGLGANPAAVPGDGDPDIVTVQTWDDSSRPVDLTDDSNNTQRYVWDALNRPVADQFADCTQRTCTYDVHDNRLTMTDANGSVVTCAYDLLNRLTGKTIDRASLASGDPIDVFGTTGESYAYDGLSRIVRAEDDDSLLTRSYDSLSRVTRETLNVVPPFNPADDRTTLSVYDGVGNLLTCTYPGGRAITCSYDELDRKQTVSDGGGTIATYDYVGPVRVERREYGNGTRTDYQYDGITGIANPPGDFGVRQIIRTAHSRIADGTIIDDRTYAWDPMYNKTRRVDLLAGGPQLTHDYVYDSIYRLTRTTVTDPIPETVRDTTYDLDGVGNRTAVSGTGSPGPYSLDAGLCEPGDFQMNQYTDTAFDSRRYDPNGNLVDRSTCLAGDINLDQVVDESDLAPFLNEMLSGGLVSCANDTNRDGRLNGKDIQPMVSLMLGDPTASEATLYVYDYRNQLIRHNDPLSDTVTTYAYDAMGRRIVRIVDTAGSPSETRYYYNGAQVVEEQDAAGTTRATYVYGPYIDEVLNMQRDGNDFFYHADDLYNVMAVTDAAAAVVERDGNDDYGRPTLSALVQTGDLSSAAASDDDLFPGPNVVQILADDFAFAQATHLTGVRWRGGYAVAPAPSDSFTIEILAADGPGGAPGTLLHRENAGDTGKVATGRTIVFAGLPEFAYEHRFDNPFDAQAGVTYWISIRNDTTGDPSTWGWEISSDGNGALAVSLDGGPWALDIGDLAFELVTDTSAIGNPYLFTGRRYDPESGWYYFRNRYLDPSAGRFITRDPIGIWGDPDNLGNGYAYLGNKPATGTDPSGLYWFKPWGRRSRIVWVPTPKKPRPTRADYGYVTVWRPGPFGLFMIPDLVYLLPPGRMIPKIPVPAPAGPLPVPPSGPGMTGKPPTGGDTPATGQPPGTPNPGPSGGPTGPGGGTGPTAPRPSGSQFDDCVAECMARNGVAPGDTSPGAKRMWEACIAECSKDRVPGGGTSPRRRARPITANPPSGLGPSRTAHPGPPKPTGPGSPGGTVTPEELDELRRRFKKKYGREWGSRQ